MLMSNRPPEASEYASDASMHRAVSSETSTGAPCAWLMFQMSLPSFVREKRSSKKWQRSEMRSISSGAHNALIWMTVSNRNSVMDWTS